MNYSTIKYFDIANGEGVRTTLFVSGCRRGCPGCFNTEAWDFSAGKPFTREIEDEILESLSQWSRRTKWVCCRFSRGWEAAFLKKPSGAIQASYMRTCLTLDLDAVARKPRRFCLSLIFWWMAHLSKISMTLLSGLKDRPIRELSILQKQERKGSFDFGKTIQLMRRIVWIAINRIVRYKLQNR